MLGQEQVVHCNVWGETSVENPRALPNLTLSDARRDARRFLSEASFGKHEEATRVSYEVAKGRFLADCEARLRPITVREYRRHLAFFAFKKEVAAIERADVFTKLDELRSTPSNQNYAFTALKVFLNWCIRNQYLTTNPIGADKRPARTVTRERVLEDAELRRVLQYCHSVNDRYTQIVELLIYTGQRRSEIAHLRWSEIDGDCIHLPPERTKNGRAHQIPIGATALDLLQRINGGTTYVFGTKREDRPFNGFGKSGKRMLTETELPHFTLHDLRRTFATNHARLGTPIHVTERLLNHASGTISGVAAVYNRYSYLEEMRVAVESYDEWIAQFAEVPSRRADEVMSDFPEGRA